MDNSDYQRLANERSRQNDEARRRQGLEDFNRNQREKAARQEQINKENYSRSLGSRGISPPPLGPGVDRTVYNRALGGYKAQQSLNANLTQSYSAPAYSGSSGRASSRVSGGGGGKAAGFIVLLVIVGAIWLFNSGDKKQAPSATPAADSSSSTPAPTDFSLSPTPASDAPSISQNLPANPDPVPVQASNSTPANPSVNATPTAGPVATPETVVAAPPVAAAPAWPAEGIRFPASRKGAENGCEDGSLFLGVSTVEFTCPANQSKSFSVALAQIKGVHEDGIELYSKQKYHFKIKSKSKEDMHQLFEQWLAIALAAQTATPTQ